MVASGILPRTESFTATVQLFGQEFQFKLFTRPLSLGEFHTVQYYWMDNSQFRSMNSVAAAANFRNCLGHWGAAMRASGLMEELEQQMHYVTAQCYPLISRNKSLQSIYRDAFLFPGHTEYSNASVPDDIWERVQSIVKAQDSKRVRQELDCTLERFDLPAKALPPLQEALRHWVGKGVTLMRRQGNDGLEKFLAEAQYWLVKYRKKGRHVWVRHFINLFAYECKVSFYRCFANTWIDLIPWLKEHRGLDPLSERFLRFWHNQNQPVEILHGRTAGGVLYPTRCGAVIMGRGDSDGFHRRQFDWQTEQIGPTHLRDAFNGQVLSLHPISGFIMQDPTMCAIAGEFFAMNDYDEIANNGQLGTRPEYWNLVGVILLAAHQYRIELETQASKRGRRVKTGGKATRAIRRDYTPLAESILWEDYIVGRGIVCQSCGADLKFVESEPSTEGSDLVTVRYRCTDCNQMVEKRVDRADLVSWLRSDEPGDQSD
jgi:hypothetical protein